MKIRKFPLISVDAITTKALVETLIRGDCTSDEMTKADKIDEELSKSADDLLLDGDDYKFLIDRLAKIKWYRTSENRKAISSFITSLKDLKEVEVKIS